MGAPYFNEGVGQGGFVTNFGTASGDIPNVVFESWDPHRPSAHIIDQADQFGGPLKSAGVAGFPTCQAVVQLPYANGVPTEVPLGAIATAPNDHGGGTWVVIGVSASYRQGDYFKANLTLKLSDQPPPPPLFGDI